MKRIEANRCGYVGYSCKPISSLDPVFQHTLTNAYATLNIKGTGSEFFNPEWTGPSSGTFQQATIDNYAQLPQKFEGFIMTLAPIIDMSAQAEVPELACRVDFNPFNSGEQAILNTEGSYTQNPATENTGFLDYYNQVSDYSSAVYVDVEGETATISSTMPAYVEGDTQVTTSGNTVVIGGSSYNTTDLVVGTTVALPDIEVGEHSVAIITGNTVDAENGTTTINYTVLTVGAYGYRISGSTVNTLTAGPGILEPMLDTSLPPIGIDTIPSADIIGDFAMWEFNTINQWQKLVDARLNGLKTVIPTVDYGGVKGLYNLKNKEYQNSACGNFQISVANPLEPIIGTLDMNTPLYEISGGTIYLNGQYVSIGGVPAIDEDTGEYEVNEVSGEVEYVLAPFTAYLDVAPSGNTASVITYPGSNVTIDETKREAGHTYIYIGAVKAVSASADFPLEGGTAFKLYKIEQGDCIDEVRTEYEGGFDYPGPFVVDVGYSSGSPYVYVGGFDGTTQNPHAGKIYLNGAFLDWGPVDGLTALAADDTPEDFVYAHITLTEKAEAVLGYTMNECIYNRKETVTVPSGTTSIVYTVRLGRILSEDSTDQIHYGDIYLYTGGNQAQDITVNYTGPFRVETGTAGEGSVYGITVQGIGREEGTGNAGKVIVNGTTTYLEPEDDVENLDFSEGPLNIYANITLTGSSTGYAVTGFSYSTQEQSNSGTSIAYNVRLARAYLSGTGAQQKIHIDQTHFGDIYIDTGMLQQYNGPFKLDYKNSAITVTGVDHETVSDATVTRAGRIFIDGVDAGYAPTGTATPDANGFVYAQIYMTRTDTGYTYADCVYTNTAPVRYGQDVYTVRLGKVTTTGTKTEVQQYHYGDIYIDVDKASEAIHSEIGYEGPFKLEYNMDGTYTVRGGAAVPGTTAGDLYLDGKWVSGVAVKTSESTAVSNDVIYAIVLNGSTVTYNNTKSTAANAYNIRLGKVVKEAAPTSVVIDGRTVSISDLAVGTKVGGATITEIVTATDITTIKYSYPSDDSPATGTVTAQPAYKAYQFHYGDLYVGSNADDEYCGPFKVEVTDSTITVPEFDSVDHSVGKIVYMNAGTASTAEVDVPPSTAPITADANGYVYLHIEMTKGATTSAAQYYTVTGSTINGIGTNVTATATTKSCTLRLARVDSNDVTQIQYGDVFIGDISEPIPASAPSTYNGPFTVEVKDGSWSIKCGTCGNDENAKAIYGWYSVNGTADVAITAATIFGGAVEDAKYVFFHKTATKASINTTAPTYTDPTEYAVRLARIDGTTAGQLHYGNIYIDGRWM